MKKLVARIEAWITRIFRGELATLETLISKEWERDRQKATADIEELRAQVAALKNHVSALSKDATTNLSSAVNHLTDHVENTTRVATGDIKKHIEISFSEAKDSLSSEIWNRYEMIVKDAAGAARIVDASKISMAICDVCKIASRRFAVSRVNGNIICADCAAKGHK